MRIAWLTDIHLNFLDDAGLDKFCETIEEAAPDAVLITGDISEAPDLERHLTRVSSPFFFPFFFILGNHDFYRGDIETVRATAKKLGAGRNLRWLSEAGVVKLGKKAALVGQEGWADGRAGNWEASQVFLSDYMLIQDLVTTDKTERRTRMEALAKRSADALKESMIAAAADHEQVLVATHVPPWREACWHKGKISNDDWLPHFASLTMGDAIAEAAQQHPNTQFTVFCGHTHSEGTAQILPNLVCRTGAADYSNVLKPVIIDV